MEVRPDTPLHIGRPTTIQVTITNVSNKAFRLGYEFPIGTWSAELEQRDGNSGEHRFPVFHSGCTTRTLAPREHWDFSFNFTPRPAHPGIATFRAFWYGDFVTPDGSCAGELRLESKKKVRVLSAT